MKRYNKLLFLLLLVPTALHAQVVKVTNKNGVELAYAQESGVKLIKKGSLFFKDLNKNGKLDKYEDWRLPAEERAKDLASKLPLEHIAGLMLYSGHQTIPAVATGPFPGTYQGKSYQEAGKRSWDLTDQQIKFLRDDMVRHVLITSVESPETAAEWNNTLQAFVEGIGFGIPANNSSDPRHNPQVTAEYNAGAGGKISMWPDGLAMAATFDPAIVKRFGEIAAQEYRALGIATALSPQIDLGTEPRWYRIGMTFGESPAITRDMARAYIDGFQTSTGAREIRAGWGYHSVNAMVKHWPSGGAEEGGRDGHWAMGKFAVFPGKNLNEHMMPFLDGAFNLAGKTGKAAAVMPYYTITFDQDTIYKENVGNGFSRYFLHDLLRKKHGYEGVICTDWGITSNEPASPGGFDGKPWGVEELSIAERHYKAILAGVDQFGGNNEKGPVLEAYQLGAKEYGEKWMRDRFEASAVRLLLNIFRTGLFENPYLDVAKTKALVGKPEFMKEGFDAQVKSVVLLKNQEKLLPLKGKKVFVPKRLKPVSKDWWGRYKQASYDYPVNMELLKRYCEITDNPDEADVALVFVQNPQSMEGGYDEEDRKAGGNGYVPISLQYRPYKAKYAREKSIAAGDPVIDPTIKDRSYRNKVVETSNSTDLRLIQDTKGMMKGKPVIVSITANKPMIFHEFETDVQAILMNFGIASQAVFEVLFGNAEPSGLLPVQMPANMRTVEEQLEDVPFDMKPHKDAQGNEYDFGFGLNWSGKIQDARTTKYTK